MQNISSEQELKQLLDEGRITEEEYKELLVALRQGEIEQKCKELMQAMAEKSKEDTIKQERGVNKSKLVHELAIAAFVLEFGGMFCLYLPSAQSRPSSFLSWGMVLAGFIMGVISWKDRLGATAVMMAIIIGVVSLVFFLFSV